jgi:DNA repair exonuclease SbcCD ATPase subunit
MAFTIKNITVKNFLSIGNQTQAVDFDKDTLTLILGKNLDLGGDDSGSRNGTGKTTMINALSYALYGQALNKIRKENLINKINGKGMLVTVEFDTGGNSYRIERGRKPNVLKLFVNNQERKTADEHTDDAQGDSRETQKHIDQLIGMSHTMFKHLVALNTYTEPFLSMSTSDQREIIEQLLGITLLSEKAEKLKLLVKDTKDRIQSESFKIEGIKKANDNIQKSINSISLKCSAWDKKRDDDLLKLGNAIVELQNVNIEKELESHREIADWNANNAKIRELNKQKATLQAALSQNEKTLLKYFNEMTALEDHKTCPSCDQELHDHKHEEMLESAKKDYKEVSEYSKKVDNDLLLVMNELETLKELPKPATTYYETEAEALGHKNNLENLEKSLEDKLLEQNPYLEQIEELKSSALQEINWDSINELTKTKDHQEFLHKLLTNKDSFIRKKIIDQNLSYLNKRLSYYIDKMGLPHLVVFQNDLSVEITQLGQDLDFDNLSRGERNRLIMSMSYAFRDVWENLYQHINLFFVDELLDSGMDPAGIEAGLGVLKKLSRERNKNVFLISHKEELIGRVNNVLHVVKENGFTSYETNSELIESE